MEEQLVLVQGLASNQSQLEHTLGTVFKQLGKENLLADGIGKRSLAIAQHTFHNRIPAISYYCSGWWLEQTVTAIMLHQV